MLGLATYKFDNVIDDDADVTLYEAAMIEDQTGSFGEAGSFLKR